jgi:UDPglucose--hexose-1-phosphate uridylyltransferase
MPELRLNMVTGDWVIIATERARRPEEFVRAREKPALDTFSAACPFCPGNEAKTPDEQFRVPAAGGTWLVRSVPNRFAALTPEGDLDRQVAGFRTCLRGVGRHEVMIETPEHNRTLAQLPIAQVEHVLRAYQHRLRAFYEDRRIEHVIIFKNHGEAAGTSLVHPHSQIVGLPVIPSQLRTRLGEALHYYGDYGECMYCRSLREELREGVRIVEENSAFAAFVPWAALSPFHLWVFPKRHSAYFGDLSDEERRSLAAILGNILRRLFVGLDDPDYNFVIRSLSPADATVKHFHWYLSLVPRVSKAAGFELGTGMFINTALPESSAEFLRNTKLPMERRHLALSSP